MTKTKKCEITVMVKFILFVILFLLAYLFTLLLGSSLFSSVLPTTAAFLPADYLEKDARPIIVLDAGHGGLDSGCCFGKVEEKHLNLTITKMIASYLSMYDVEVVLTREEDVSLHQGEKYHKNSDVKTRVEIAKKYENALFVSIHMNSFPIEKYRGFQVYYSKNAEKSEALALQIESGVKNTLPNTMVRPSKSAGSNIYVLNRLYCQAVLIECGFLSNESDRADLTNETYQKKLAFVIARAIAEQAYAD